MAVGDAVLRLGNQPDRVENRQAGPRTFRQVHAVFRPPSNVSILQPLGIAVAEQRAEVVPQTRQVSILWAEMAGLARQVGCQFGHQQGVCGAPFEHRTVARLEARVQGPGPQQIGAEPGQPVLDLRDQLLIATVAGQRQCIEDGPRQQRIAAHGRGDLAPLWWLLAQQAQERPAAVLPQSGTGGAGLEGGRRVHRGRARPKQHDCALISLLVASGGDWRRRPPVPPPGERIRTARAGRRRRGRRALPR